MSHPIYRCKAANIIVNREPEVKELVLIPEIAGAGFIYPLRDAGKREIQSVNFKSSRCAKGIGQESHGC